MSAGKQNLAEKDITLVLELIYRYDSVSFETRVVGRDFAESGIGGEDQRRVKHRSGK